MPYYEIQVLVSDDSTAPMTRIDRCTLTAGNLADAAATYAGLFTSEQARFRPDLRLNQPTAHDHRIGRAWTGAELREHLTGVHGATVIATANMDDMLVIHAGRHRLDPAPDQPVRVREHKGFGHGLRSGDTYDMNCPSCQRERAEDVLVPGEDDTCHDDDHGDPWDDSAASLLPTNELMNPAHPEGAMFYDEHQVAYVVRQLSPGDPAGTHGPVRVLTSYGPLHGWTLDTEHAIRHDQSGRSLGLWLVTGIRNSKTGWYVGAVPDRPLRQWVFK
jgi:hypothetical protein